MKLSQIHTAFKVLIDGIESKGVENEGLYRISGIQSHVVDLSTKLFTPRAKRREMEQLVTQEPNIHVLAATLKQLLRAMQPPLLPDTTYDTLKNIVSTQPKGSAQEEGIAEVLSFLPDARQELISLLRNHLVKVAAAHEHNRMTMKNLVLILGPTIMRKGDPCADGNLVSAMQDQGVQINVCTILFANNSAINSVLGVPPLYKQSTAPVAAAAAAHVDKFSNSRLSLYPPKSPKSDNAGSNPSSPQSPADTSATLPVQGTPLLNGTSKHGE